MDQVRIKKAIEILEGKPENWVSSKGESRNMLLAKLKAALEPFKAAVLVAIRAAESFDRHTILKQGDYSTGYYGQQNGVRTHSPVMDMTNEDVYRFFSVFDVEINKAYSQMCDAGIPLAKMRIGSLFNSHAGNSSSWLAQLDPAAHQKIIGRVEGLDFHNAYGGRTSNSKYINIPQQKPFNVGRANNAQQHAIELLGLEFIFEK